MDQQPPGADEREEDRAEDPQTDDAETEDGVLGEISPEEPEERPPAEEAPRPRRRQRSRMIGCLLALLGALAGGGVAWWVSYDGGGNQDASSSQETVHSEEAASARLVFAPTPARPDETPEIISAETSVIYCFYELGGVPADAPLSAEWSHDGEFLGELPLSDHRPADDVEHARGHFTVHPPADRNVSDGDEDDVPSFPPGIYEVQLTSPDYPDITAAGSFVALPRAARVLQGGGDVDGPPLIRSLQTATGVTEDGQPVDRMSAFPPDTDRITAVFSYSGVPAGSVLTVRWYADDREITDARSDIPVNAAEGWAEAWLETDPDQTLPPGEYRVSVHLGDDDEPLGSTGFLVQAAD
ncbi:MAG: hypothetical protein ACQER1_11780 [Armatimonadota bacterium]